MDTDNEIIRQIELGSIKAMIWFLIIMLILVFIFGLDIIVNHNGLDVLTMR